MIIKSGMELENDPNGIFLFDIEVENAEFFLGDEAGEGLKAMWNMVLEGCNGFSP